MHERDIGPEVIAALGDSPRIRRPTKSAPAVSRPRIAIILPRDDAGVEHVQEDQMQPAAKSADASKNENDQPRRGSADALSKVQAYDSAHCLS